MEIYFKSAKQFWILCLLLSFVIGSWGYYLPGTAPVTYEDGQEIPVRVDSLTSINTQLPVDYYSLPFCRPSKIENTYLNLGQILQGNKVQTSVIKIESNVEVSTCVISCKTTIKEKEIFDLTRRIKQNYRVNLLADSFPVATPSILISPNDKQQILYKIGYPLGGVDLISGNYYLYNHLNFKLQFQKEGHGKRIVGFDVLPESILHTNDYDPNDPHSLPSTCTSLDVLPKLFLSPDQSGNLTVLWTYSINWEESDVPWSHRWDKYLKSFDTGINWFSLISSVTVVVFLSGIVVMILMKTLKRDLGKFSAELAEEDEVESGWKLVHSDVFRPPVRPLILSILIGSGVQMFGATVVTLFFAMVGLLSPANQGGFLNAAIISFVLMGVFGGYFGVRTFKMLRGKSWRKCAVLTAVMFPGILFLIYCFLDIFLVKYKSSAGTSFGIIAALFALWICISVPLSLLGGYFAFRKNVEEYPTRVNQIPRQIPEVFWYQKSIISVIIGGILPFGVFFVQLYFILMTVWMHQYFDTYGFLFITLFFLIFTCSGTVIIMVYLQLCREDYRWWWNSFLIGGASAFYLFLYCIFFLFTKIHSDTKTGTMLFIGCSLVISLSYFVLTGTIGYYATFFFLKKIYSSKHFS